MSRHRTPTWEPSPRLRRLVAAGPALSLAVPMVATAVLQSLAPDTRALPTGLARFAAGAAWWVAQPSALLGYHHPLDAPALGWWLLGVLERAALGGAGLSVLAALAVVAVALAVASVALIWLVVRRHGGSPLAAGAAAALLGVMPEAVAVHAQTLPVHEAVLLLLLAAVAATHPRHRSVVVPLSGVLAGLAVVCEPVGVLLVPLVLLLGAFTGARPRQDLATAAAGVGAAVVLAAVVSAVLALVPAVDGVANGLGAAAGQAHPGAGFGAATLAAWATRDPVGLLLGAAGTALVARPRRTRSLAATTVLVVLASLWPFGGDAAVPAALLLPLAAVASGLAADRAVRALGAPRFVTSVAGSGWLMGLVAGFVVALVVAASGLGALGDSGLRAAAEAVTWIRTSVPTGRRVLVDVPLWPDASRASSASVGWYAVLSGGRAPSSSPWSTADVVVATRALTRTATGAAGAVLRASTAVREFGAGATPLEARRTATGGPLERNPSGSTAGSAPGPSATGPTARPTASATPSTSAELAALAARKQAGAELARNPALSLPVAARAQLTDGEVDTRLDLVLGQLLAAHRVTVAAFGLVPGDVLPVRRTVAVTGLDGRAVPGDAAATRLLVAYFRALKGAYAMEAVTSGPGGVLAELPADPTFAPAH